jgi:predicted DNA-binding WGR domain protein
VPLYEFEEGSSRKFYRIELAGTRVHLNWGRIGTDGEHQVLVHATEQEARAEYDRQRAKRTYERGYRLVVDEDAPHDPESVARERLAKPAPLSDSPRFLFVHRKQQRFAWVEARGAMLLHAEGLQAEVTKPPTQKPCGSAAAAVRERDAMVAKWLRKGYELDTFGVKEPPKRRAPKPVLHENLELERVVAEDAFDDARWQVLEDWLLEREDDARAELVRFEKAGQRADEAEARGKVLPSLLGPKHAAIAKALVGSEWRAGFLLAFRFHEPKRSSEALFAALLAAPAARLVRELELELELPIRAPALCTRLAMATCARSIRLLDITLTSQADTPAELDGELLRNLVRLERLRVRAPELRLRNIGALPGLRALEVMLGSVDELRRLVGESLPVNELTLDVRRIVWRDAPRLPNLTRPLAPLLARVNTPALEHLKLYCDAPQLVQELAEALRTSPLLPQLRTLSFGGGKVPPIAGFEHLDSLELPFGVRLSP